MTTDPTGTTAWIDNQGDVWTLGDDGLMHSRETQSFPRGHVERKWGPLRPVEQPADPTGTGGLIICASCGKNDGTHFSWCTARTVKPTGTGAIPQEAVLEPAESMCLTIVRSQSQRGVGVSPNTAAVLVMTVDRLTADLAAANARNAKWHEDWTRLRESDQLLGELYDAAKADLAAARQQLDAVRTLAEEYAATAKKRAWSDRRPFDAGYDAGVQNTTTAVLAALAVAPTDAPATKDGQ